MKMLNLADLKIKILKNKPVSILLIAVVIIALFTSLYFYYQYKKTQSLLSNPNQQAVAEAETLVNQVGKLIELPPNEKPTVATVSDITKLKNQAFFANAQNGDKVLIYSNAKKAILYRPSINKIIEVAPVNSGNTQQSGTSNPVLNQAVSPAISPTLTPTTAVQKIYKVALLNGTLVSGLAGSTQTNIEQNSKDFIVSSKGDASNNNYSQTIVVDVSGNNKDAAEELVGLVNGKVGALPSGEKLPSGADFLVILGTNK